MRKTHSGVPYRPDIDGLRAVAVISVVVFHAFPNFLTGGFIGVDIFFVISGYLISSIIFTHLNDDNFSFINFYSHRIKRIFPSLTIVLSSTLFIGIAALLPFEYIQLNKHIAGSTIFISNFILMQEMGYFDTASEAKPLLHLWSLAIEEQFYLLWPVLLVIISKQKWKFYPFILAIGILSFFYNVNYIHTLPKVAFYSPFSRVWELLTDALLAYHLLYIRTVPIGKNRADFYAGIGIFLIIFAILFYSKSLLFPGYFALLPTIGTVLIIAADQHSSINKMLSQKLLVSIGLISYPLYLWHWPLLSFAQITTFFTLSVTMRCALILLSVFLAWLTYVLVEKPIRLNEKGKYKTSVLFFGMIGIGCLSGGIYYSKTTIFNAPDYVAYEEYFHNSDPEYQYSRKNYVKQNKTECNFWDTLINKKREKGIDPSCYSTHSSKRILLWGDSHAEHLYYGLFTALPSSISFIKITTSYCIPSIHPVFPDVHDSCNTSNQFVVDHIKEWAPDIVILAQRAGHEDNNFNETAHFLKTNGVKKVILMGPTPQWNGILYEIIMRKFWHDTPSRMKFMLNPSIFTTNKFLKEKYANSQDITLISPTDYFCDVNGCITYFDNDKMKKLVTYDYGHMTPFASGKYAQSVLAPAILALFKNMPNK